MPLIPPNNTARRRRTEPQGRTPARPRARGAYPPRHNCTAAINNWTRVRDGGGGGGGRAGRSATPFTARDDSIDRLGAVAAAKTDIDSVPLPPPARSRIASKSDYCRAETFDRIQNRLERIDTPSPPIFLPAISIESVRARRFSRGRERSVRDDKYLRAARSRRVFFFL